MKPVKFFAVLAMCCWLNAWFLEPGVYNFYAMVTLPGTFLHESAHYLMAAMLDGHPGNFNLIPSGDILGSVTFYPNWYNPAPVSWAPLLLMPFTAFFAAMAARAQLLMLPVWGYVSACSWAASTPSPQDYHNALVMPTSFPFGVIILAAVTWAVYKITRRMVFT
jgi:hypothetical protein